MPPSLRDTFFPSPSRRFLSYFLYGCRVLKVTKLYSTHSKYKAFQKSLPSLDLTTTCLDLVELLLSARTRGTGGAPAAVHLVFYMCTHIVWLRAS